MSGRDDASQNPFGPAGASEARTYRTISAQSWRRLAHGCIKPAEPARLLLLGAALAACTLEPDEALETPAASAAAAPAPLVQGEPAPVLEPHPVPASTAEAATNLLVFRNEERGCFHHKESNDSVAVTDAALAKLRAAALASRGLRELDPAALGITQASVERHRADVVSAIQRGMQGRGHEPGQAVLERARGMVTLDYVRDNALDIMASADNSTSKVQLEVELPGEPRIVLSSEHGVAWMLPWTVRVGETSWETYSTALPLALSRLLPESTPSHRLLDGGPFWNERFWTQEHLWTATSQALLDDADRALAESLPGFRQLDARFNIANAKVGLINLQPRSLFVSLDAKESTLVDGVRWFNRLDGDVPKETWHQLLAKHDTVSRAAQRLPWLKTWKESSAQRSIEAQIAGTQLSTEERPEWFVLPAWRHAQLPDEPPIELLLRRENETARIYISETATQALVVSANTSRRKTPATLPQPHWLDPERVSFHPAGSAEYLLVAAHGNWQRHTVPADFPPLAQARQEMAATRDAPP